MRPCRWPTSCAWHRSCSQGAAAQTGTPGWRLTRRPSMLATLFPHNERRADRIIRLVVGLGLLSLVFIGPKTAWGYVGLVPLLTGLIGSCPAYRVFGIDTCPH